MLRLHSDSLSLFTEFLLFFCLVAINISELVILGLDWDDIFIFSDNPKFKSISIFQIIFNLDQFSYFRYFLLGFILLLVYFNDVTLFGNGCYKCAMVLFSFLPLW